MSAGIKARTDDERLSKNDIQNRLPGEGRDPSLVVVLALTVFWREVLA